MRRSVTVRGGAARVAARMAAHAGDTGWFWLDGEAAAHSIPADGALPAEDALSYLGIAAELVVAEPCAERAFLDRISGAAAPAPESRSAADSVPSRGFTSGWVAALGYEFGEALLGLPGRPEATEPGGAEPAPAFALRADVVLAVAGEQGELRADSEAEIDAWLAEHGAVLAAPRADRDQVRGDAPEALGSEPHALGSAPDALRSASSAERAAGARWRQDDRAYAAAVEACKDAIREGDAYVICLTDTLSARTRFDPVELFLRLRAQGGAMRAGVIVAPGRALVSASPERFLSVRDGQITTHPIKGTRPRGVSAASDAALAEALRADPKERAENLMIVDLMRNDLSRVCMPGTVAVPSFLRVETHPHVHQLVSTVTGALRPGLGAADAIAACFPGGSMTGAPKRRAVEILRGVEAGPRGLYAGCFGWLDRSGDAELAMTIRSVEYPEGAGAPHRGAGPAQQGGSELGGAAPHAGFAVRIGAGGGITADSRADAEVAEKHLKAAALLRALGR